MNDPSLTSIGPIDGRYASKTPHLAPYFSEFGLIHYRVKVEIAYLIKLHNLGLAQLPALTPDEITYLENISENFSQEQASRIKEIEKTTNHDVKAVEYWIKEQLQGERWEKSVEFVHFGLTSQDINNTAIPWSLKDFVYAHDGLLATFGLIITKIEERAEEWKDIPMLARTHGQPATPTRLGKEFKVFSNRLRHQLTDLKQVPFTAKFGGATGNMNAHYIAYPNVDWHHFAEELIGEIGLKRSFPTTQIEHYDYLAAFFDNLRRINTILIDFCRDVWQYIAMDYFKQSIKKDEIGSSAMPHKVNPIDFENAEGNLGIANAVLGFLSEKLPVSRLQRDLTDSTVLRNIGVPMAHTVISLQSILKGLDKLLLNESKVREDLDNNWAVLAEAIQTILRREGYPKPYETLKALTRTNEKIDHNAIASFVDQLDIREEVKSEIRAITPFNYTGR